VAKDILVAALGNTLMSDEGVAVAVLGRLSAEAARFPRAELMELGASAMRALHAMAGRRKAVFVDCALMGEQPGTIRRFTPEQVQSRKALSGLSLHEGDLLKVIELSRALGECPEEVVIFGIEPQSVEPGEALLRVSLMATHTFAQIERALEKFQKVGKALNLLG
jgi:hydrogenase maturation protease